MHVDDSMPSILVWGAKSQARITLEMLKESNLGRATCIFDSRMNKPDFHTETLFLNDISLLKNKIPELTHFVVCIAGEHGFARYKISRALEKIGLLALPLIHEKSFIEPSSTIGKGPQIMPCSVVHKFCEIGDYVILNTNASIDHECTIGHGVHIMGGASIAGKVSIGDYATVGTNATILPFIKIGEGAFIGAGAVVTKDVEPYTVVTGVPAKIMKTNKPIFFEQDLNQLIMA